VITAFVLAAALATPPPGIQHLRTVQLHAPQASLTVQVADNKERRERGLMNVRRLPVHTGMLFVFPMESIWSFWMKDTLIDLDMVWLRRDGTVSGVAARVPHVALATPNDKIPTRDGFGAYVIELPAGEAAQDGLTPGARVAGLPPLSSE